MIEKKLHVAEKCNWKSREAGKYGVRKFRVNLESFPIELCNSTISMLVMDVEDEMCW